MKLRLRVLNGPLKGRFTPLKAGMVFGRGPKKVGLKDSKLSGSHAKVFQNESGQLILQDLQSRNGVKVDGRRVQQVLLRPGQQFQMGNTFLKVESGELQKDKPPQIEPPQKLELEVEADLEPEIEVPPPEWPEYFQEFVAANKTKIKDKPKELFPLPHVLQLKFLRGVQIDWVWDMGYGPRTVGRTSLDFPLYDEAAPDLAFRIRPMKGSILLETPHSKLIKLNDKFISTEELNDGDLISVGSSLIQVKFRDA